MNWRMILIGGLIITPLLTILTFGFGRDPHHIPSVLEGQPAADFSLPTLDGHPATMSLTDLRGKPAVINFWATWCTPCKDEDPLLQAAAKHYADRVQFIGVVYQDEPNAVRQAFGTNPPPYPQLMDHASKVAIAYGVAGVPETFFLDGHGRIIAKHAGALTKTILEAHIQNIVMATAAQQPQTQDARTDRQTENATAHSTPNPYNTTPAAMAYDVGKLLRCPVCQGMPIAESPSPMAQDMMKQVRSMADAGQSREEIIAYFVSRYGEWVLLKPTARGFNILVWVLPPLGLLMGGLLLWQQMRRSSKKRVQHNAIGHSAESAAVHSDPYADAVEQALRR